MRFTSQQRRRTPTVIIVSLIDVLMVVLIFLMVTTNFRKLEPALKLALPEAKNAKAGEAKDERPFTVTIATNAPFYYMDGIPVTFDRVETELKKAAAQNPRVAVAIKADKRSPFGEVLKIIDIAKGLQVGSINAITERTGP